MGKAMSMLNRQVNRFNVENRAQRIISKDKPVPAPRYPSNIKELNRILQDHPEVAEEHRRLDARLDERLKQVYVVSHDPKVPVPEELIEPEAQEFDRRRQLPLDRQPYIEPEYGFQEPAVVPRGKFSLRQAIKFISEHQADPVACTPASIAHEYQLSQENTDKILQYYRTFEVYLPEKRGESHEPLIAQPTSKGALPAGQSSSQASKM